MGHNLLDRLSPFPGTGPEGLAFLWIGPELAPLPGTPVGLRQDSSRSKFGLDLTLMKQLIPGLQIKDIGMIADQGFGKTFLIQTLLYFWTVLSMRFRFDSLKRNNRRRPETAPLVEDLCESKIISPYKMRLNPLSRRFKMVFEEKLRLTLRLMCLITGVSQLSLEVETVVAEALRTIEDDLTTDPSYPLLWRTLKKYAPSDVGEMASMMESADGRYLGQIHREQVAKRHQRLIEAAFQAELAIGKLNQGVFASLLSGEDNGDETFRLFAQRAVSIDFFHVDDLFRSVIETVLNEIENVAGSPRPDADPSEGPRIPELIVNVRATDEAYSLWENTVFAEADYVRRKTRRASGDSGIMAFHRLRDFFEAIGNEASGRKARNALSEIKVWFIGRQPEDSLLDVAHFFGLPVDGYVVKSLPTLRVGEFWLILPGYAPIPVLIIGTEKLVTTFNTEGAHNAYMKRYFETGDEMYYITYLDQMTREIDERNNGGEIKDEDSVLV